MLSLKLPIRNLAAATSKRSVVIPATQKPAGDISSVFPSLSGVASAPLQPRFATLKSKFLKGNEEQLQASWDRLIKALKREVEEVSEMGIKAIPTIEYKDIAKASPLDIAEIKRRGTVVIRNVVPEEEALQLKADLKDYIRQNPKAKAFPAASPAVYELYWSPSQVRARSHPSLLKAQKFVMSMWHSSSSATQISVKHPLTYADRLRIRLPGDAGFALGAHVDGGSLERWEDPEYNAVYKKILQGDWEKYDAYDARHRVNATMDLYNGAGSCAMFRMWQGWLSMSNTGPNEGTLLVNPLLKHATAYMLLRPFFAPSAANPNSLSGWRIPEATTPEFPGAVPAASQEFNDKWHPHLNLSKTMVHVPRVAPGDFVAWHCDTIHSVDRIHNGTGDSSVLYIPAVPLCKTSTEYAVRQRDAFLAGVPPPDFPSGDGETGGGMGGLSDVLGDEGRRAMGLGNDGWSLEGLEAGERDIVESSNKIMGWN